MPSPLSESGPNRSNRYAIRVFARARRAVAGEPFVTTVVDYKTFQLRRIFAQGWNAARRLPADTRADSQTMAELNPHKSEAERTRWNEGFLKASE